MNFFDICCKPMAASRFVYLTVITIALVFNPVLYAYVFNNVEVLTLSGLAILFCVFVVTLLFTFVFFSLFALIHPRLLKAFLIITFVFNAAAIYYMTSFNVILDKTMIGNILNTRFSEASELLTLSMFLYIVFLGLLPAILVYKAKVNVIDRLKIARNAVIVAFVSILILYSNGASWPWVDKHAKVMGGKILPWSYLINSSRYYAEISRSTDGQTPLPNGQFKNQTKQVVVLVIGETARAANFSLYGYEKNTNPQLARQKNLLVLNNAKSCTTYTTGSIACMLAANEGSQDAETLPTYLNRHGVDVIWRTNNWGEPPIDVTSYIEAGQLRSQCEGHGCKYDEVLLTGLEQQIRGSDKQKIFVVLHTKGSHGPSYYTRYPPEFEQFTPVCKKEEISKCTSEELTNAYDNTLLFADHFLTKTMSILASLQDIPATLIYVSDHGESLGEHGLYLHGTPYTFAPDVQKDIPFLIWQSESEFKAKNVKLAQLQQQNEYGHYHVFHTIIGALGFDSPIYEPQKDILNAPN